MKTMADDVGKHEEMWKESLPEARMSFVPRLYYSGSGGSPSFMHNACDLPTIEQQRNVAPTRHQASIFLYLE